MDKLRALLRRWLHLDWVELPPTDPLSATAPGEHRIEFVSRHSIAETGLTCPVCGTEAAPLGSYAMVQRSRLGELIVCGGRRQIQDTEIPCGMYLCASPDTEHGDEILYDKVPLFERHDLFNSFVRISKGDAARLKYGEDVNLNNEQLIVTRPPPMTPKPIWPLLAMEPGQVWYTDLNKPIEVLAVQVDDDPLYRGWAKGRFQNSPDGWDWHIDSQGFIRQSMRDPTQNDHGRLTHKV